MAVPDDAAERIADAAGSIEEEDVSLLGLWDTLLLVVVLALAIYYLFLRKPKQSKDQQDENFSNTFSMSDAGDLQKVSEDSFIGKMKAGGRNVVVFYGSQTGTAEEFAGRTAKEAGRYGLKGMVADPEECDMEELASLSEIPNSLAIFCMATYGEGDPTDNALGFFEWLQNTSGCNLTGMHYAVFGLGNKTYEHYNEMAIYVDRRLCELGATRIFELGLGDDDGNMEEDFIDWKERFWPSVCEKFGLETDLKDINMRQYKLLVQDEVTPDRVFQGEVARLGSLAQQRAPYDAKNPFLAKIITNRELHKGGDRSCMHIEIDITGSKIRYETGDHVAVFPANDSALVSRIGELLDTDLDTIISLVSLDADSHKKNPFPCPSSYRTALTYYLDITCIPYTHVLKEIAEYASDPAEKEMLQLMGSSSAAGKARYQEWVITSCRNIVQILEDLPSLKPDLDHLCELLPRLQARYYSISSSPKIYPEVIHVTAVKVEYKTPTGRTNRGVATTWLADKRPEVPGDGALVPVYVRKSQFRLPAQPLTPVIMIGPGTGLAPFRAFIQERNFQKDAGKPVGDSVLYFGCRKRAEDFLYEEELAELQRQGALTTMHLAFSRDQDKKVYVTDLLRQNAKEVWNIIGVQLGHIYVCGDARTMARDVHQIIKDICKSEGEMSEETATAYIKKMEFQKRYSADVWS